MDTVTGVNDTKSTTTRCLTETLSLFFSNFHSRLDLFSVFVVAHLIGVIINHIEDTDETYGYWEPLHFLLYHCGFQTWEYSPIFAIRTYAFILPFYCLSELIKTIMSWIPNNFKILPLFYILRTCIALFTSYCESYFISQIRSTFGMNTSLLTMGFMLTSPGIFYSSTSFLPSAIASSLVMLAIGSWLQQQSPPPPVTVVNSTNKDRSVSSNYSYYLYTIGYGCIAVLWTGWPFIGLLLLPLGLHMLYTTAFLNSVYTNYDTSNNNIASSSSSSSSSSLPNKTKALSIGIQQVMFLCCQGAIILFCIGLPPALIDSWMYGKITCPTLNIFLYNVFGSSSSSSRSSSDSDITSASSGDELYGVEPWSYYVKNLFLNVGVSLPLALLFFPIVIAITTLSTCYSTSNNNTDEMSVSGYSMTHQQQQQQGGQQRQEKRKILSLYGTIMSCTFLWIGVLFRRPHKEERFMYPVYPLLCLLAAASLTLTAPLIHPFLNVFISRVLHKSSGIHKSDHGSKRDSRSSSSSNCSNSSSSSSSSINVVTMSGAAVILLLSAGLGVSRIVSNYYNFHGYLELWTHIRDIPASQLEEYSQARHSYLLAHSQSPRAATTTESTNSSSSSKNKSKGSNNNNNQQQQQQFNDDDDDDDEYSTEKGQKREYLICTGNEWYLFPGHILLHHHNIHNSNNINNSNDDKDSTLSALRIGFVREQFHGLLPQYYHSSSTSSSSSNSSNGNRSIVSSIVSHWMVTQQGTSCTTGDDIAINTTTTDTATDTANTTTATAAATTDTDTANTMSMHRFNDQNREDMSKYVDTIQSCDFYITSSDTSAQYWNQQLQWIHNNENNSNKIKNNKNNNGKDQKKSMNKRDNKKNNNHNNDDDDDDDDGKDDHQSSSSSALKLLPVLSTRVLNAELSTSSLFRAYYIPHLSRRYNVYKNYTLYAISSSSSSTTTLKAAAAVERLKPAAITVHNQEQPLEQ